MKEYIAHFCVPVLIVAIKAESIEEAQEKARADEDGAKLIEIMEDYMPVTIVVDEPGDEE